MTKAQSTTGIEKATGKSWDEWIQTLSDMGAREMSHTEIARKLYDILDGTLENHGWWAQGITVAYEQHIGRRIPGQLPNGNFEISVSKTVSMPAPQLFMATSQWLDNKAEINDEIPLKPRASHTPKRNNWRCNFGDGSKLRVTTEAVDKKTKLVITVTDILDKDNADKWKLFWQKYIPEMVQDETAD